MGFFDRFFGVTEPGPRRAAPAPIDEDARAVERYRYLLRTAPPETIEQVHVEAFARLTDAQRCLIYEELSRGAGTGERPLSSEPATLARAATRAEMRVPGSLERILGAPQAQNSTQAAAPGLGTMFAGSLLGTVAGFVVGSALVSAFLPWDADYDASAADEAAAEFGDFGDVGFGDVGF